MLSPELNPHPELEEIWKQYQQRADIDWLIKYLQSNECFLPPIARRKRLEIAQTIKTQRLLHGI